MTGRLNGPIGPIETEALLSLAEAWEAERVHSAALSDDVRTARLALEDVSAMLAAAQKRVEVLEQDRRWWQENAIKRRRRAEARGRPPRSRKP